MADYNTILGTDTADNILTGNTSGDDSLALLAGNDTVTGSGGIDIVDLGTGNDRVTQAGNYTGGTILGGTGNDTFYPGFNASLVDGGLNNDSIVLVKASVTLNHGGGLAPNDTIFPTPPAPSRTHRYGGGASGGNAAGSHDSISVGTLSSAVIQGNAGQDISTSRKPPPLPPFMAAEVMILSAKLAHANTYLAGNRGGDTLIVESGISSGTTIYGGGIYDTTNDGSDSLRFGSTLDSGFVQMNAGDDTLNIEVLLPEIPLFAAVRVMIGLPHLVTTISPHF